MPLLPKEIELSPETLFTLPAGAWPWRVAHVRSRQEKVLARHLARNAVPFYLPQIEVRHRAGARVRKSYVPLFPGYVFFRGEDREVVFRSNTLANLIEVPDQERFGRELEQIRALQLAGASLRIEEELVSGQPVKITDGPFRGYVGILLDERRKNRMVVQLSLLRQSVTVELDREVLRRAPRRAG